MTAAPVRWPANGHPHLAWGGSIEVLEFLSIPGMRPASWSDPDRDA